MSSDQAHIIKTWWANCSRDPARSRLLSQLARTRDVLRITRLDTIKRDVETMLHQIAVSTMEYFLLGRSQRGIGDGIGVDISGPELESESEIRRLRSPALHTNKHGQGHHDAL